MTTYSITLVKFFVISQEGFGNNLTPIMSKNRYGTVNFLQKPTHKITKFSLYNSCTFFAQLLKMLFLVHKTNNETLMNYLCYLQLNLKFKNPKSSTCRLFGSSF